MGSIPITRSTSLPDGKSFLATQSNPGLLVNWFLGFAFNQFLLGWSSPLEVLPVQLFLVNIFPVNVFPGQSPLWVNAAHA